MIQLYDDGKGQANSCEATLTEPEALGLLPLYGFGPTPQAAVQDLKRVITLHIARLQVLDYNQLTFFNE